MNQVRTQNSRLACITLDIEADFVDFTPSPGRPRYYGLFDEPGQFERFCNLIARYGVKLTCFVLGEALQDRADYVRELSKLGAEFGSHSLTHDLRAQGSEHEVRGGIEAFAAFFGHLPRGYRAPFGKLKRLTLEVLDHEGVLYDSSFIPSISPISPNVYRNLYGPTAPFRWQGLSLVELPIAVFPRIWLPVLPSYMKVLGKKTYSILQRLLGFPAPFVTFLHPMNLTYSPQAFSKLSTRWKVVNSVNRFRGFEILEWLLIRLRQAGFRFASMSELYDLASSTLLPERPLV